MYFKKLFVSVLPIFLSIFVHFQEYKVYGYFHQNWNDPRLAGKFNRTITLTGSDIDNVWVPDPFCYNARESNMMIPNEEVHSKLHISTNGDIKMSKGWVYSHIKRIEEDLRIWAQFLNPEQLRNINCSFKKYLVQIPWLILHNYSTLTKYETCEQYTIDSMVYFIRKEHDRWTFISME